MVYLIRWPATVDIEPSKAVCIIEASVNVQDTIALALLDAAGNGAGAMAPPATSGYAASEDAGIGIVNEQFPETFLSQRSHGATIAQKSPLW